MSFNITQEGHSRLVFTDGTVPVDGEPVRARVALVPESEQTIRDHWGVLLFGRDYSAHISLDNGMTPEELRLSLKDNTADYTDIRLVLRNIPER